ncbi:MAG: DUF1428 domain-containing protein [Sphingomonas sp.]|uniref:DUF1428 domain-containing protein n=1 Tax=Sphingomonas sp. TaxID=28214 RepID=UPI001AFFC231|nr:DUF1428 domain-containing protein [Sphingomonas sp.]MBO9621290.1 DUF1428 domain-containing protein [Sphingomonas sp.]
MAYLDGFVVPVPEGSKQAYQEMAAKASKVFLEYGALRIMEGWGSDVPRGTNTDFFMATKAEEGENVVFSWIIWPDKATRDTGWEKIMKDERMQPPSPMPFDGKRMFWGGFEPIVDESQG